MQRKIYIPGETTYDIIFKNEKPVDAKVGGSQLNTAVSLGRCRLPVSFISSVGNDKIGEISLKFMKENNVSTDFVLSHPDVSRVALAFLDQNNNADYTFFNPSTPATSLTFPTVNKDDIVLFGSSFAIKKEIRKPLLLFLQEAKQAGAIIVYDPNFRRSNIARLDELKPMLAENFEVADIVKGSDEDFEFIFDVKTSEETSCMLADYDVHNLLYTSGKSSVKIHSAKLSDTIEVPEIEPVSTIGAGDNFNAGVIFSLYKLGIQKSDIDEISAENWQWIIKNAIAFAQNVCMAYENYVSLEFAGKMNCP